MTKCWMQPKARRTRRHHGKNKMGESFGGNDYKTKPKRGHTWRGHGTDRRCAHCKMSPPGKGLPGVRQ